MFRSPVDAAFVGPSDAPVVDERRGSAPDAVDVRGRAECGDAGRGVLAPAVGLPEAEPVFGGDDMDLPGIVGEGLPGDAEGLGVVLKVFECGHGDKKIDRTDLFGVEIENVGDDAPPRKCCAADLLKRGVGGVVEPDVLATEPGVFEEGARVAGAASDIEDADAAPSPIPGEFRCNIPDEPIHEQA